MDQAGNADLSIGSSWFASNAVSRPKWGSPAPAALLLPRAHTAPPQSPALGSGIWGLEMRQKHRLSPEGGGEVLQGLMG